MIKFFGRINNENLISNIENIRKIRKKAEKVRCVINNNDFIAPFPVNILLHFNTLILTMKIFKIYTIAY